MYINASFDFAPGSNQSDIQQFQNAVNYVVNYFDSAFTNWNVSLNVKFAYGEAYAGSSGSAISYAPMAPAYSVTDAKGVTRWYFGGGQNMAAWDPLDYGTVRNRLLTIGTDSAQPSAYSTLPTNTPFTGDTLYLTSAQEKAIGFTPSTTLAGFDGVVGIISSEELTAGGSPFTPIWDTTAPVPGSNQVYMIGFIEHELSEVMGRYSWDGLTKSLNGSPVPSYTLMDMFRYSETGGVSPYRATYPSTAAAYFSIDNGTHSILYWSIDSSKGDLGDWAPNGLFNPVGNDAFLNTELAGNQNTVSENDKILMNVLGWDRSPQGGVSTNAPPPQGTTTDMVVRHLDGSYEIRDIANNTTVNSLPLNQYGSNWGVDWKLLTVGSFQAGDTSDMLLRNVNSADPNGGSFEIYNIQNNNITSGTAPIWLLNVGLDWQVLGFGDFNSGGETDMLLRNTNTGDVRVYDIKNGYASLPISLGNISLDWQPLPSQQPTSLSDLAYGQAAAVGNFSSRGEADMILRNTKTGEVDVYDISNNRITSTNYLETLGSDLQIVGAGNFSSIAGETDILLRSTSTGAFRIDDISNNQVAGSYYIGTAGIDPSSKIIGFGPMTALDSADMVLRDQYNVLEVIDISNNQFMYGTVLDRANSNWLTIGFADLRPSVALKASSVSYVPGQSPLVLESGLTLMDPTRTTLAGATVSATAGTFAGDGDVLAATTAGTRISASYNNASETLTLTGTDTLANYQTVLRSVSFASSSGDPAQAGAHLTRTLSWAVNDGSAASAPAAMAVNISRLPVLTVSMMALAGRGVRGEQLPLSSLVSVSDPDHVGFQKLELWDSNGTVTGGQFVVNGVAQTGGHEIDVAPADMSKTVFDVGTLGGADTLWAQLLQKNGQLTGWQQFWVSAPPDTPPTVTVANKTATHAQTFAASSLFTASDPDGDTLTQYAFWDAGTGGGHFVLSGVAQGASQEIDVTAAQLSQLRYQSGTGADTLWVRAYDGTLWSSWSNAFTVTAPPDTPPTVSVSNVTATHGQSFAASSLFTATDADGDTLTQYGFWDTGALGAHFVLNGVAQGVSQEIDVSAAQLSQLSYQSGSGADTLWVRAYDGMQWSGWSNSFTVTAPLDNPPAVSVSNVTATHGQSFAASSLFTVRDADGDAITKYAFWDTGAPGADFVLDGVAQPSGQEIDVTAAQLSQLSYQSGSGADTLWVRANDGLQWSGWSNSFTVTAPVDSGPVVTPTSNHISSFANQTFSASSLFTYNDPFGSPATQYDFWNSGDGGGHFVLNGKPLPANQDDIIPAAQLGQLSYQVGTANDKLWVRANDGTVWGGWSKSFTISDPPAVAAGETITLGSAYAGTVSFLSDTGMLKLENSSSFTGTVAGLCGQDAIDFGDIGFGTNSTLGYSANADHSGGTLSVGDGTHMASISLLGSYMASTFVAASDGHGGTLISEAAQTSNQTPIVTQPHA